MLIEKVETSLLTEKMIRECDDFFNFIVIKRLNRGLRNQMMFYLTNQEVPFPDHKEFLEDIRYLFDFLDRVGDELYQSNPKNLNDNEIE